MVLDQLGLNRLSLARFLASEPGFEIAGDCGTAVEALEVLERAAVDVILLDADFFSAQTDFIPAAREAGYRGQFVILAGSCDARKLALALKLGVSGIFLKSEPPERLSRAIRHVSNGEVWIDQKIIALLAGALVDRYPALDDGIGSKPLDDRERAVLAGIVGGLSNRKIGEQINISESSVKNVVQRLFNKAGVKTRSQLVRIAMEGSFDPVEKIAAGETIDGLIAPR